MNALTDNNTNQPLTEDSREDWMRLSKVQPEDWAKLEDEQKDLDKNMREKLERRANLAAKAKEIAHRTYRFCLWALLVFSLLTAIASVLYVYKDKIVTDYDKFGMDTRNCIAKVGDRTITGSRTYAYRYMTVLGYKIFMTPEKEVEQETRLDVTGNSMTILGTKLDGSIEKTMIGDGEKYRQLLKSADHYTFFMDGGKNTAIIAYNALCK